MRFSERLKKERKKHKYSQSDLAKYMQVSQVSISYWERGIKEPDFEELIGLSKLFNKSTDYMLGVED
ncbi:MAG: helix-turn-helix domain-containing protein [Christensenella sp.]|nr:helix-turn-helix domain-containing protein [Christensenella sp.]